MPHLSLVIGSVLAWFKICRFWVTMGVRKPPACELDVGGLFGRRTTSPQS